MKKIKLTKYEQWIEDHVEEFVPVSKEQFELIKRALEAKKAELSTKSKSSAQRQNSKRCISRK